MELHWANSKQLQLFLEDSVWDRKYKQMIYNTKWDVTKIQQEFYHSLLRVFLL